ncbi:hypothetical protein J6590_042644 [Homalodisca vitripennis]|nr:hypothetical protein J6590_042644 [Homalodisca vitripennis]
MNEVKENTTTASPRFPLRHDIVIAKTIGASYYQEFFWTGSERMFPAKLAG